MLSLQIAVGEFGENVPYKEDERLHVYRQLVLKRLTYSGLLDCTIVGKNITWLSLTYYVHY